MNLNSAVELHKTVKTLTGLYAAHLMLLTHWVKHQTLLNPFVPRATANIQILTAEFRMKDKRPKAFVKLIMRVRRCIETVIGQLAEQFDIEKCGVGIYII